jgi:hypothetical protein
MRKMREPFKHAINDTDPYTGKAIVNEAMREDQGYMRDT